MAKFVVLYTGGMGMAATPEEQEKIMAEWGAWYGMLGEAIVDGGAPFGAAKSIASAGSIADGPLSDTPATGYTGDLSGLARCSRSLLFSAPASQSRWPGRGFRIHRYGLSTRSGRQSPESRRPNQG